MNAPFRNAHLAAARGPTAESHMRRYSFLALVASIVSAAPLAAQSDVDFQRDIRPLLSNHCFKCHGPAAQEGGLRLDLRERALKRQVIVPKRPEASKLLERVLAADEDERMPPAEAGERLKPAQIALLKKWIAAGAEYTPHWAFTKPRQAALPKTKASGWARNEIDHFILARLENEGLRPSAEAERSTLIRRLALDLTGLVPTPQEVDQFVNDRAADSYEKLVERLLASPHYGERQARHWLDLARYADSNGYTIDGKRTIWPWRDWVIEAFNRDLPFDRFTIEQLAGDLLPGASKEQIIATGFHRNTSFNEEGGTNPEQFRVERTVDRTNTTGAVWLGLTVGCAQCHNHKYDPISHKEYYQLYAFFNSMDEPRLPMPTPEQSKRLRELNDELAEAKRQPPALPKSSAEVEKIVAELEKETNGGWRVLNPKGVTCEQGSTFRVLDDRSVLASGKAVGGDTYVLETVIPETGTITAVRLEALTDPSLPHHGPGRAANGNFVLSQLVFETDGVPHSFRAGIADNPQKGHEIDKVVTGDLKTGWAGGSAEKDRVDRQAVLLLKQPYVVREGQAVLVTLRFSQAHPGYALGRFRLAVTFASERLVELPLAAQNVVFMERDKRSTRDMESLRQALLKNPAESSRVAKLQKSIKALDAEIESTLILRETAKPRPTNIQKRGDFLDPGEAVQPGVFSILPPLEKDEGGRMKDEKEHGFNRLDLARWLVSADNPLTPRVVVNRVWQQYFGKGLVETENDFGMQGSLPTHPELLDWLAVYLVQHGWGMKDLHRLIVTSATYRQASAVRPDLRAKDPNNVLLGRQHRLRLEAEIIRDAALAASGLLTRKIGGAGVFPPQPPEIFAFTQNNHPWPESKGPERYRRGMYTFIWRQSQHPLLTTFDAPDAQTACTRRNRSNTPLQALHLANDPTFVEIAQGLADRVTREGPRDDTGRIDHAFKLCFCRPPADTERSRLLQFLEQQRQSGAAQPWTMLARVLLNLDEFVTRE
jgi:mono/diheme cytochrome c family protein